MIYNALIRDLECKVLIVVINIVQYQYFKLFAAPDKSCYTKFSAIFTGGIFLIFG